MSKDDLILKPLSFVHLARQEIVELQRLQGDTITFADVRRVIGTALEHSRFFPPHVTPEGCQKGVYQELLEQLDNGRYRVHWPRAYAWAPNQIAESGHSDFTNLYDALQVFRMGSWNESHPYGLRSYGFRIEWDD